MYEHEEAALWGYFVCGAPCTIISNLGVSFGIANGTSGRMHSLTTRDGSDISDDIKCALARGETELEISPPLAINVTPDVSKRQRRRLLGSKGL